MYQKYIYVDKELNTFSSHVKHTSSCPSTITPSKRRSSKASTTPELELHQNPLTHKIHSHTRHAHTHTHTHTQPNDIGTVYDITCVAWAHTHKQHKVKQGARHDTFQSRISNIHHLPPVSWVLLRSTLEIHKCSPAGCSRESTFPQYISVDSLLLEKKEAAAENMQSLFPSRNGGGLPQTNTLLSFKAGKCNCTQSPTNGKYRVSADGRRGKISLERHLDGLLHFHWTDRSSGRVEEDRIVFPGDVVLKRINTGTATDRVYVLRVQQAAQFHVFWMQDRDESKDTENCAKFNDIASGRVTGLHACKYICFQ
jgi:hypothetical protein